MIFLLPLIVLLLLLGRTTTAKEDDDDATTPVVPWEDDSSHQCHSSDITATKTVDIAPGFALTILQDSSQALFLHGKERDATGTKVWPASECLAGYLHSPVEELTELLLTPRHQHNNHQQQNKDINITDASSSTTTPTSSKFTIMELGAGVGLPSLTLARKALLLNITTTTNNNNNNIQVVATDREPATLEKLRIVAQLNHVDHLLGIQPLDWKHININDQQQQADVILAADVVYHENMVETLVGAMTKLLVQEPHGIIYLALSNQRRGARYCLEEAMPRAGFELLQALPCSKQELDTTIYIFRQKQVSQGMWA